MYIPRIVDAELQRLLAAMGAVVIEGPKATGKTETARQVAASEVRLDVDRNAREAVDIDPSLVLEGDSPRLIDEWQIRPELWNHIRRAVDDSRLPGRFILTGSAVPVDDETRHTGAARMARMRMRPMSLYESGHSTGQVSLSSLLEGEPPRTPDPGLTVPELAGLITTGGWPVLVGREIQDAVTANRAYIDEIRRTDIQRAAQVAHEPDRVFQFIRSLARNVATYATLATLVRDIEQGGPPMDEDTGHAYMSALTRLMVVEDQPAWAPHLRSRSRVRSMPKRHFVDPSLAVAALRATPERLLNDLNFMGFLFESLVVRDLRVYAQALDAEVLQYRDNTGLEVDAIVETADGRWGAFEIKLGSGKIDEGAASLLKFAERVDTARCGEPAVLGVIVGAGLGYRRRDGVAVIPIGALAP
jgi:predicted AAA+ superfamily ATPase